ncbi:cytochrome c oxidase subunit 3 [Caldimonas sp. KR1-144]|uniref:cytochrome c oxidase subunit 3 n=1 Tax=Caldimonas sp. KR1-144 TaxID=3400911 RepID=UPI003C0DCD3E
MSATTTLRTAADRGGELPEQPSSAAWRHGAGTSPSGIALWVFFGVATSLFSLFTAAYVMRAASNDWVPVVLPWQLWLSSALLMGASGALAWASSRVPGGDHGAARDAVRLGGVLALGFLAVQAWAWLSLADRMVLPRGQVAASFFFLLTAMHGLHVAGGLLAWTRVLRAWDERTSATRVRLLARYWHFLLIVWLALLALIGGMTPELARAICGVS